jgi:pilus assembly protein CpaE
MRAPKVLVVDETEELSLQVRRVTESSRPTPEVVWCQSWDEVEATIHSSGPFEALVAGPITSKTNGFQRLRSMRADAPETQLLLALNHWRGSDLRETVRAGALDILRLPVPDDTLLDSLTQALDAGARLVAQSAGRKPPAVVVTSPGIVVAVVSASGGSGKTFFATNLAFHLQSQVKKRVCLIDLDLQFGELSTALRMRPRHTIADLVSHEGDDTDLGRRFEDHLEEHESGFKVLAAPEDPAQADAIEASDVARVIDAARSRFDYVVVDTPTALSEAVLVALEQADQIFVLATLDLPSVRNLGVMLATLKKLKVPTERVSLLLNKVEPDVGIDVERVEQYFPQGFSMIIPYGREVNRSLNMGQPVLAYAPRGDVSKVLASGLLANVVVPEVEPSEEQPPERHRRLRRSSRKAG